MTTNRVAITGLGITSAVGNGVEECWQNLLAGVNGIDSITRFNPNNSLVTMAATNPKNDKDKYPRDIITKMMHEVIEEATSDQNLEFDEMYYSLTNGLYDWPIRLRNLAGEVNEDPFKKYFLESSFANELRAKYKVKSMPSFLSNACAASAKAIELGVDRIKAGQASRVLVAASDCCVAGETIALFGRLSALSTQNDTPTSASAPFSEQRDGFVIGEGAAALILEDEASAKARKAKIYGYVLGTGHSTDNFHRTKGDPEAKKITECMESALENARISFSDLSCIYAHGTSTVENDKMELRAIEGLAQGHTVKLTSVKSMIGHSLYAAGVINAVCAVLGMHSDSIPPTINFQSNSEVNAVDFVTEKNLAWESPIVMSNSYGFGGQNVSLIFCKSFE